MIETENLCVNCPEEIRGICCNYLAWIEGHLIYLPNHPCKYLNLDTRKCSIYEKRHEINPNCLTLKEMYIKGTLPKNCPYIINDSTYQKRKDIALLALPFNISDKGKFEFSKLNNQEHSEIGCYDIIRTSICPKCESGNITEEWDDRKDVLFFKYKCNDCNHKWNNFEKQNEFRRPLFICVHGCGAIKLKEMKNASDPEDPTLVCPKCGRCTWYITPKSRCK